MIIRYTEDTSEIRVYGEIHPDPVGAFNDIADPFLESGYWDALGVDEEEDEEDGDVAARKVILDAWRSFGGRSRNKVFAWHEFEVRRDLRGKGMGRSVVTRIEDALRNDGVRGVILQAGAIDDRHSLPFWRRVGYSVWPLEYGIYDDRILWKML